MDSKADMFIKRARTEIGSADILFQASEKKELKESLKISDEDTFYSGVISHAYYSIFYCVKAMLLSKDIETKSPEIHRKTLDRFKEVFINTGILDAKLLTIYKEMIIRAEALLEIFKEEKRKRGDFTYNTIPQANKIPAEESLERAKEFYRHSTAFLTK